MTLIDKIKHTSFGVRVSNFFDRHEEMPIYLFIGAVSSMVGLTYLIPNPDLEGKIVSEKFYSIKESGSSFVGNVWFSYDDDVQIHTFTLETKDNEKIVFESYNKDAYFIDGKVNKGDYVKIHALPQYERSRSNIDSWVKKIDQYDIIYVKNN